MQDRLHLKRKGPLKRCCAVREPIVWKSGYAIKSAASAVGKW